MGIKHQANIHRRQFLKATAISGVGFAIGSVPFAANARDHHPDLQHFGDFVRVSADNTVTVVIKHLDKGQGVTTGLTAIVADEMDADWAQMSWEFAPADASKYNNLFFGPFQATGGSTAVANSWMQLRNAGAAAKAMLVEAAAKVMKVDASQLTTDKGFVIAPNGQKLSYGELAEVAAHSSVPETPVLKTPEQFTLIGTDLPRIDSKEKSTGKATYTIDVRRPGMLSAVVAHPPKFGAKVKSFDPSAAKKVSGVKYVVEIPRGIAVVADNYWDALQGRNALKVEWDFSSAEQRGTEALLSEYRELANTPGTVVRNDGDFDGAIANADKTVDLQFEFPFLAHATMEPMNCVIELNNGECHVWTGSQFPTSDKMVAAQITGTPPEKTFIHTEFAGGSFGRRANPANDFVLEAAMVLKAIDGAAPISLQWSREDDMHGGYYRPMTVSRLQAGIKGNKIDSWHQRVVSQSLLRGTFFESMIQGPVDSTMLEGGTTLPYAIANLKVDAHEHTSGVPVLWWRSVGHTFNGYATEVFFNEAALAAGQDPVAYRLELLAEHPRHAAVLKKAAEAAKWGRAMPANKALGVAVHESFSSFVAQVAEVTVNQDGSYSVDKVWCAVDCGVAITPDVVRAQMEGGVGFGIGAAMGEQITLNDGQVNQANFYNYFPMRMNKMPDVEVVIVNSGNAPTGVGEPGVPPAGPAVANALRKFLKAPITTLPFGDKLDLA